MTMKFESDAQGAVKLQEYLATRPGEIVLDGWKYLPRRAVEQLLDGKRAIYVVGEHPHHTTLAQYRLHAYDQGRPVGLPDWVSAKREDVSQFLAAQTPGAYPQGASMWLDI